MALQLVGVSKTTKRQLDFLKENVRETYDDVIYRLIIERGIKEENGNDKGKD